MRILPNTLLEGYNDISKMWKNMAVDDAQKFFSTLKEKTASLTAGTFIWVESNTRVLLFANTLEDTSAEFIVFPSPRAKGALSHLTSDTTAFMEAHTSDKPWKDMSPLWNKYVAKHS